MGFFAFGASAAIQWEQVARMQQLQVMNAARFSLGPAARCNNAHGAPDGATHERFADDPGTQGQLVYYFQAVDKFRHFHDAERYMEALKFVNLSKSAGLMGMFGCYLGMRVRLKKKLLAPELVQEAAGEIVGMRFHPRERFGCPSMSNLRPPDSHDCWKRGWVLCDYLPMHIEVRWDGSSEDYTGLNKCRV